MDKASFLQPVHRTLLEHGTEQLGLFTGQERRIAEIASQFLADERVDPIYTHPGLCLTVLPHREIPVGKVWERQTGYASLLVHPLQGHDGRMRGVPFGAKARLIGDVTKGSSGRPMPHQLGNGVTVHLSSWEDQQPDGAMIEGRGVRPDTFIKTTPRDMEKSDATLDAALKFLRGKVAPAAH